MTETEAKPRRASMLDFLEDEPTPAHLAVPVPTKAPQAMPKAAPPEPVAEPPPPVPAPAKAPQRAPVRRRPTVATRPEAEAGDYPWRTARAIARANVRSQVPVRLLEGTNLKLTYLYDQQLIRSKANLIEKLVEAEADRLLLEHFTLDLGLSEAEARRLIVTPEEK